MQINGGIQSFRTFQNWREEFVVEIAAARMPVDDRALEPLLTNPEIELVGCLFRNGDRQRRERRKAQWVLPHGLSEKVVGLAPHPDLHVCLRLFHPGSVQ